MSCLGIQLYHVLMPFHFDFPPPLHYHLKTPHNTYEECLPDQDHFKTILTSRKLNCIIIE